MKGQDFESWEEAIGPKCWESRRESKNTQQSIKTNFYLLFNFRSIFLVTDCHLLGSLSIEATSVTVINTLNLALWTSPTGDTSWTFLCMEFTNMDRIHPWNPWNAQSPNKMWKTSFVLFFLCLWPGKLDSVICSDFKWQRFCSAYSASDWGFAYVSQLHN